MRVEIADIIVKHPEFGDLHKKSITIYDDLDNQVSIENYSPAHYLWGCDPNNLTEIQRFMIRQYVGV